MKLKVACKEANHFCDKNQYKNASFWEQVKLNIHLIYCRACRKYSAHNNKLTSVIKSESVHIISTEEKAAMRTKLQQEINAQN